MNKGTSGRKAVAAALLAAAVFAASCSHKGKLEIRYFSTYDYFGMASHPGDLPGQAIGA